MSQNWSITETDWQGVDNKPELESQSLINSGSVFGELNTLNIPISVSDTYTSRYKKLEIYSPQNIPAKFTISIQGLSTSDIDSISYLRLYYGTNNADYDYSLTFDSSIKEQLKNTGSYSFNYTPSHNIISASIWFPSEYTPTSGNTITFTKQEYVQKYVTKGEIGYSFVSESETNCTVGDNGTLFRNDVNIPRGSTVKFEITGFGTILNGFRYNINHGGNIAINANYCYYQALENITSIILGYSATNAIGSGIVKTKITIVSDVEKNTLAISELQSQQDNNVSFTHNQTKSDIEKQTALGNLGIGNEIHSLSGSQNVLKSVSSYENGYLKIDGTIGSSETRGVTDFIDVSKLISITPTDNIYGTKAGQYTFACFYDASFNFIKRIYSSDGYPEGTITIESDYKYVRFSMEDNTTNCSFTENYVDIIDKTIENSKDIIEIQEELGGIIPDDTNPLSVVKETAGFTSILHRIGVVGASLTNGGHNKTIGDFPLEAGREYSWTQRLARLCGITCFNFGQSGYWCKYWLDDNGGYYSAVAEPTNKCDAYIISFASNDADPTKADYPLGTISDVHVGNESQNGASYYGYLSQVIARCHEVQERAYLFVLTYPHDYSSLEQNGYTQAMRDIVTLYKNSNYKIYLIDYATYGMSFTDALAKGYARGTHYVGMGYQYMTYEICTYIDWIIRHNVDDFKDIAFVRTTAEYDTSVGYDPDDYFIGTEHKYLNIDYRRPRFYYTKDETYTKDEVDELVNS